MNSWVKSVAIILGLFLLFVATGCQGTTKNKEVTKLTISAAASMTDSLLEIKKRFEEVNPEIEIVYNFGGTGSLRKQIEQGAPVDLFFSASEADYEKLVDGGFVNQGKLLFTNQLVIIKSKGVEVTSLNDWIHTKNDKKIAIGTPEAVPAGTYAKEALESMNQWDPLYNQFVFAKDVTHILTLVKKGSADIGFVYQSDAFQEEEIDILEKIPSNIHSPINYYVAILKGNKQQVKAEKFFDYVISKEGQSIFESFGFAIGK